jgi:hypothetical protein
MYIFDERGLTQDIAQQKSFIIILQTFCIIFFGLNQHLLWLFTLLKNVHCPRGHTPTYGLGHITLTIVQVLRGQHHPFAWGQLRKVFLISQTPSCPQLRVSHHTLFCYAVELSAAEWLGYKSWKNFKCEREQPHRPPSDFLELVDKMATLFVCNFSLPCVESHSGR